MLKIVRLGQKLYLMGESGIMKLSDLLEPREERGVIALLQNIILKQAVPDNGRKIMTIAGT
ncbi:hypothetical protein NEILACOT_05448 [Neisseria lactamica ATCC 23970]|uniref:Uncharacterized protein n=1 Tax=Neisseria lactamica ATCC 23970 TaxID=546265 RepID=D0WD13_NEILA|nr:hypothetical protein NEILACOT_05448 [Neisseria lactamica ATCC 23970]KFJ35673.1 hypothetical protein DR91_821 [Neisseria lactamica ATCC 23970]VTQ48687.1 Uncharacterised protein [Neisseria lactamica]